EKLAKGNRFLAVPFEFREVRLHALLQIELAAFDQEHHRRRAGDNLGQRRRVEDGVFGHRFLGRRERAFAVGLMVRHAISLQPHDRAWTLMVGNGVSDGRIHLDKFFRVEDGLRRRSTNRCLRSSRGRLTRGNQQDCCKNGSAARVLHRTRPELTKRKSGCKFVVLWPKGIAADRFPALRSWYSWQL